ncbi:hypothetical protein EX30DRAFT_352584 [Ascodesmis nigricans]|uniref:Uncharacterized protein n=1 Tax=Ascodesmis nigricans TaxID=341454 RepID=A0A4S2MID8_9PEZI|nr:hypothetical protein EX30DRAFT_352584 [Ascodesmis nigricans]
MTSIFVGTRGRSLSRPGDPPSNPISPPPPLSPKSSTTSAATTTIDYRPISTLTATAAGGAKKQWDARSSLLPYIDADHAEGGRGRRQGQRRSGSGAATTAAGSTPAMATAQTQASVRQHEQQTQQQHQASGFFSSIWALGTIPTVFSTTALREVVNDVGVLYTGFSRERRAYAVSSGSEQSTEDDGVLSETETEAETEGSDVEEVGREGEIAPPRTGEEEVKKEAVQVVRETPEIESDDGPMKVVDEPAPTKPAEVAIPEAMEAVEEAALDTAKTTIETPAETPAPTTTTTTTTTTPPTVQTPTTPTSPHVTLTIPAPPESPKPHPIRRPSVSSHRSSIRSFPLDEVARLHSEGVAMLEPEEHVHEKTPQEEYAEAIVASILDPKKGVSVVEEEDEEEEEVKGKGKGEDEEVKLEAEETKPAEMKPATSEETKLSDPSEPTPTPAPERRYTAEEKGKARMVEMVDGGVQTSDRESSSSDSSDSDSEPEFEIVHPPPPPPQRYTSLLPPPDASHPAGPTSPAISELTPPPTPDLRRRQRANSNVSRPSKEISRTMSAASTLEPAPVTPRRRPTLRSIATDSRLSWIAGKHHDGGLQFDADGNAVDPEPHRKKSLSFVNVVKKAQEQRHQQDSSAGNVLADSDTISVASSAKKPQRRKSVLWGLGRKLDHHDSHDVEHAETPTPTATTTPAKEEQQEEQERKPLFRRRLTQSGERPKSMFISTTSTSPIASGDELSPSQPSSPVQDSPSPRMRRRGTLTGLAARPLSMFVSDKEAAELQNAVEEEAKKEQEVPVQRVRRRGTMSGLARPLSVFLSEKEKEELKNAVEKENTEKKSAGEEEAPMPKPRRRGTMSGLARPLSMFLDKDKDAHSVDSSAPTAPSPEKDEEKEKEEEEAPMPRPRRRGTMSGLARPLSVFLSDKDAADLKKGLEKHENAEEKKSTDEEEAPMPKPRRRPTMSGLARPLSMFLDKDSHPAPSATPSATPAAVDEKHHDAEEQDEKDEKEKKHFFRRRPTMSGLARPVSGFFNPDSVQAPSPSTPTTSAAVDESSTPATPSIADSSNDKEKEKKPGLFRRRPTMSGMSRPVSGFFGSKSNTDSPTPATPAAEPSTPLTPNAPSLADSADQHQHKPTGLFRRRPTMSGARPSASGIARPSTPSSAISAVSAASSLHPASSSQHQEGEPKRGLFRRSTTLSAMAGRGGVGDDGDVMAGKPGLVRRGTEGGKEKKRGLGLGRMGGLMGKKK